MTRMPHDCLRRSAGRLLSIGAAGALMCGAVFAQSPGGTTAAVPKAPDVATPAAKAAPADFWFNAPAAPMTIERREIPQAQQAGFGMKSWLGLANRSSQRVVRYDVGCVVEDQGRVKVMSTLFWVAISEGGAAPGHFSPGIFRHGDPGQDEQDATHACRGGRLSVVLVGFGDGSIWSVKGAQWAQRPVEAPQMAPEPNN